MTYDENLAQKIRAYLRSRTVEEKPMFGSLCFMVDDKMCVCAGADTMLCRLSPAEAVEACKQPGIRPMIMRGRTSKNYVRIDIQNLEDDNIFTHWMEKALVFNAALTK